MKKKKLLILTSVLALLALAGLVGSKTIQAQDSEQYPVIVQKLVEKFGLDANEVQNVFQEHREEKQEEMQVRFEEKLSQAVSDGQITEEQKSEILARKAEMRTMHEKLKDLSPEERQTEMKEHYGEMKAWLEENGMELKPFLGSFGHKGFRAGYWGMKK